MGFEISAIQIFQLDRANAEEFLEVYKGVVQEYSGMIDQLITGPCIALEIRAQSAPQTFREFVGPVDPVSFPIDERNPINTALDILFLRYARNKLTTN